jgi:hypothetical protein
MSQRSGLREDCRDDTVRRHVPAGVQGIPVRLYESWSPLATAQGGKLIVAAPGIDTILYLAEDTPVAIDALRTLTQNVMSRMPRALSSELLRWTPQRWEVVR